MKKSRSCRIWSPGFMKIAVLMLPVLFLSSFAEGVVTTTITKTVTPRLVDFNAAPNALWLILGRDPAEPILVDLRVGETAILILDFTLSGPEDSPPGNVDAIVINSPDPGFNLSARVEKMHENLGTFSHYYLQITGISQTGNQFVTFTVGTGGPGDVAETVAVKVSVAEPSCATYNPATNILRVPYFAAEDGANPIYYWLDLKQQNSTSTTLTFKLIGYGEHYLQTPPAATAALNYSGLFGSAPTLNIPCLDFLNFALDGYNFRISGQGNSIFFRYTRPNQ